MGRKNSSELSLPDDRVILDLVGDPYVLNLDGDPLGRIVSDLIVDVSGYPPYSSYFAPTKYIRTAPVMSVYPDFYDRREDTIKTRHSPPKQIRKKLNLTRRQKRQLRRREQRRARKIMRTHQK